jgi:hypothetical protein
MANTCNRSAEYKIYRYGKEPLTERKEGRFEANNGADGIIEKAFAVSYQKESHKFIEKTEILEDTVYCLNNMHLPENLSNGQKGVEHCTERKRKELVTCR